MAQQLLMPKATAVWLVDNTALSFDQIATFCKLHPLEVKAIADGEAAQGIKGLDPIATGQLSRDEIARAEGNPNHKLKLSEPKVRVPESKRRGPRYTPVSKRQDRPNAILWLVRNHPELKDAQISRLVGTTKSTIEQIRDRTHWNSANLTPMDPVTLGLCSQIDLDLEVERASRGRPLPTAEELGNTLQPATATEGLDYNFQREEEEQIDADALEMRRAEAVLQPDGGRAEQQHAGRESGGIHLLDRGEEHRVGAGRDELGAIVVEGARVLLEILMRRELRRVDEDRDDHPLRMALALCDQRDMALVQRAHGRHQRHLLAGGMPAGDGFAHRGDRLENRDSRHLRALRSPHG